jgi:membrane-associated protein
LHKYAGFAPHAGVAKHYWMLTVLGGALIVALVTWAIRRRRGGGAIEPAVKPVRKRL